jgi:hypothetical protein
MLGQVAWSRFNSQYAVIENKLNPKCLCRDDIISGLLRLLYVPYAG